LATALQTILEIGDKQALEDTIRLALGNAELLIEAEGTRFRMSLQVPGLLRPLDARELSDGQLRFLCLCAALLSPRPPSLLGLNEPESSLHPDLIDPLARLIVIAARTTQLWITTHSQALAERIEAYSGIPRIQLQMRDGETIIGPGPST
jgi:predicted ATPase